MNKYTWNESMVLDKLQEVLKNKNIDELEFTEEELLLISQELSENTSLEEINDFAFIIAENIDELKALDDEDAKEYIKRLKKYLETTTVKCIVAEFKGIKFDVTKDSSVEEIFNDYYSKYDEIYGISQMLSDLGLK